MCSSAGTCPPGLTCVRSENVCRVPCGSDSDCSNVQYNDVGGGGNGGFQPYRCDNSDHYCRRTCNDFNCNGGGGSTGGPGCLINQVCDFVGGQGGGQGFCRPSCAAGSCPGSLACVVGGNTLQSNPGNPNLCLVCKPGAASINPAIFTQAGPAANGFAGMLRGGVAGDLNGDGRPDLVVGTQPNNVYTVFTQSDGSPRVGLSYGVNNPPNDIALGDFNGDGKLDVLVALGGALNLFLNDGTGKLRMPAAMFNMPGNLVRVGDFNGDGKLDAVVTQVGQNAIYVLAGDGMGGLTPLGSPLLIGGNLAQGLAVADFNGDGKPDIAWSVQNSTVNVWLNDGTGVPSSMQGYHVNGSQQWLVANDMNNDGKPDLIVAGTATPSSQIAVLLNKGDGTFPMNSAVITSGYNAQMQNPSLVSADFNGDGLGDVAFGSSTVLVVLAGDGTGALTPIGVVTSMMNMSGGPSGIYTADFDLDGKPDLAASMQQGDIDIFLDRTIWPSH
jgi:hypothetical protein